MTDETPIITDPAPVTDPVVTAPIEAPVPPLSTVVPPTPTHLQLLEADFIKKFRSVESFTAETLSELFHWVKAEIEKI